LAQPIGHSDATFPNDRTAKPVLCFAGEACHEQYFSTTHGAFLSGMEQAAKIVQWKCFEN
jgi:Flavin containing amine oxidoreductase